MIRNDGSPGSGGFFNDVRLHFFIDGPKFICAGGWWLMCWYIGVCMAFCRCWRNVK